MVSFVISFLHWLIPYILQRLHILIKWGIGEWVKETNYNFSNVSMATSLTRGGKPIKKVLVAASILLRTVLARLDFWHNILHVTRKRIVVQTVLILQSPSLGVTNMMEYNIHSTNTGPLSP